MAGTYPATFPRPDTNGYSGVETYGLSRTGLPTANPRQIKTFNADVHSLTLTFSMSQTLYSEWICWFDQQAVDWFYMDIVTPRTPVTITSTNLFRMVAGTQQTKRGHDYISVTASFEMIPGYPDDPAADPHTWLDFIDAGTPANPSSLDTIQAGTPASPSTNIVIADLYGYE